MIISLKIAKLQAVKFSSETSAANFTGPPPRLRVLERSGRDKRMSLAEPQRSQRRAGLNGFAKKKKKRGKGV